MSRLLLDEDLGPTVARLVAEAGHDVRAVILEKRAREDPDVLADARADDRILVTCDRDFSDLVFYRANPTPPGVIYLRVDPATREDKARYIIYVLASFDVAGQFVVVKPDEVRPRPLPESP